MMNTSQFRTGFINGLTWYRILAAPALLALILTDQLNAFKWMLIVSFLTDAIDGPLARRYRIASEKGAQLDSLGDDLTVGIALIGMLKWNYGFLADHWGWIVLLFCLFALEVTYALIKFGRMTAFHTYISKTAAVLQGIFLCWCFLLEQPHQILFYIAVIVTAIGLMEEIILVKLIKVYKCNVKGLYWLIRKNGENDKKQHCS